MHTNFNIKIGIIGQQLFCFLNKLKVVNQEISCTLSYKERNFLYITLKNYVTTGLFLFSTFIYEKTQMYS